jgi:hypothetical protein
MAILNVQMPYVTRQRYGYDCFEKKVSFKWISLASARLALMESYLLQNQFQHRMITFTCKSNPELRYNQLITLDVPQQYAPNANSFTWGKSSWGDGSMWTPGVSSLKISSSTKWRVISIRRKLNLSPDMQVIAVQAGIGQDSEI